MNKIILIILTSLLISINSINAKQRTGKFFELDFGVNYDPDDKEWSKVLEGGIGYQFNNHFAMSISVKNDFKTAPSNFLNSYYKIFEQEQFNLAIILSPGIFHGKIHNDDDEEITNILLTLESKLGILAACYINDNISAQLKYSYNSFDLIMRIDENIKYKRDFHEHNLSAGFRYSF